MNVRSFPARRFHMARLLIPGVAALVLALGGCKKPEPPQPPPVDVTVADVEQSDVPVTQEWVASLYGFVDAQIRAQVSGILLKQNYKEGSRVRQGDLLFEIDPRIFQSALAQAEGQLAQAEAQFGKTEQDVKRYRPLAKEEAISQQELDDAVQANLAAKAQIASAKAAVDRARLDFDFARITSPVDGIAGIAQAQVGDLVGPATGVLTTVSTLDPIKVYFPINEQAYLDFTREHPEANGFPPDVKLELILSDGSVYSQPGTFYATDRQVDPNTGTLRIAATFPNPRMILRPGQYGRVRAIVRTVKGALVVPQRALTELQGGYQLATVDSENTAHIRIVKPGPQNGNRVVIEQGLKPGERVIVEGIQKVREGVRVNPLPYKPSLQAAAN